MRNRDFPWFSKKLSQFGVSIWHMYWWGWNEGWGSNTLPLSRFIEEHPRGRERGPDFWYLLWCFWKQPLVQVIKPANTKSKRMNGLYSQLCSIISSKYFICVFHQSYFVFSLKFHPGWSSVILNRMPLKISGRCYLKTGISNYLLSTESRGLCILGSLHSN